MTEKSGVPQIFDERLRAVRRARAATRLAGGDVSFLLQRCVDDVADRIQDVNRSFKDMLLVGPADVRAEIIERLPINKQPDSIYVTDVSNIENSDLDADLVISLLSLQSENDLPGYLTRMSQQLRPDGLFIVAIFGGDTLTELRQALYKTDEALLGGLTARIFPMVTHSQAAPLLVRAGLNLPVVDMDRFTVRYGMMSKLVSDLRDLGETNILQSRSDKYLGKGYPKTLEAAYRNLFAEGGKLPASFEILWLTGWKPHESQQKPLKPGSAKTRLADALGAKERKL